MENQDNKTCCSHNSLVKVITAILFIFLPYLGFVLGMQYQTSISPKQTVSLNTIKSNTKTSSSTNQNQQTQIVDTTSWKMYKFSDKTGFGYEIKVPSTWKNIVWLGGHANPQPIELAQNFCSNNCRGGAEDRIQIMHFVTNDPVLAVNRGYDSLKRDSFKSSLVKINNISVEKLTGNITGDDVDYYVYIKTQKGYYQISGRQNIREGSELSSIIFDQILSTFRFE